MGLRIGVLLAAVLLSSGNEATAQTPGPPWSPVWPTVSESDKAFATKLGAMSLEEARTAIAAAPAEQITGGLAIAFRDMADKFIFRAPEKSLPLDLEGLDVAARLGDTLLIASMTYSAGNAYYFSDDADHALAFFTKAETMLSAEHPKSNVLAKVHAIRASLRMNLGDLDGSTEDGVAAFNEYKGAGDEEGMARTLNNLGNTDLARGSFTEARQHYEEGLVLARKAHQRQGEAYLLNNIANTYLQQENSLLATEYCLQSLKIKEEIGNKADLVTSLLNLARIYERSGRRPQALETTKRALALATEINNPGMMALSLSVWGSIETQEKNYAVAIGKLREGYALTLKIGDRMHSNEMLVQIAEAERLDGQNVEAVRDGSEALKFARSVGFEKNVESSSDIVGMAEKNLGHMKEARTALEEAIGAVEQMREDAAGGDQAASDFFSNQVDVYQALTQVDVAAGQWEPALLTSEREKGRSLLDVLTHGGAGAAGEVSAREKNEERKLRTRVEGLVRERTQASLASPPDVAELAGIDQRLRAAHDALSVFRERLSVAHPDMGRHRGEAQLITLEQVGQLLPSRSTAVLEYEVTEEATYLFVLTRGTSGVVLHGYTIGIGQAALRKRVDAFHKALMTRDPGFVGPAKGLYQLLLGPAAKDLAGKSKVIVVPSDELWHLPFQALENAAGRYVIDDFAVSFAPSLSVLKAYAEKRSAAKGSLVAFGDPASDLPEASAEVEAVAALYGASHAKTFLRQNATLENYRTSALPGDGQEILLATHGVYNDKSPMDSYLLLAAARPTAKDKIVQLDAGQIAAMRIRASLVVLSACDTAEGKYQAGEGLVGLGWSFLAAGSQSAIASQWSVDSSSTTELMIAFHRGLQSGVGRAAALRKAEMGLAHSAAYRHPFYWAGFVLLGND